MSDSMMPNTEREAIEEVKRLAAELAKASSPIWNLGDGFGGFVRDIVDAAYAANGLLICQTRSEKQPSRGIGREVRERVIAKCGLVCAYCRNELEPREVTIDHVIPVSLGGGNQIENLTIACRSCNSRKGARL